MGEGPGGICPQGSARIDLPPGKRKGTYPQRPCLLREEHRLVGRGRFDSVLIHAPSATRTVNREPNRRDAIVTEMSYGEFEKPSEMQGASFGARPALAQMRDRLVHIRPTGREDNVPSKEAGKPPYTRLTCDVTFLSGDPITNVVDRFGAVTAQLDPPVQAGQIMSETFISQGWFVSRLKEKVGAPGFPGVVGILAMEKTKSGSMMWMLRDPSPEQMAQVKQWFVWAMANRSQALYVANISPQPPAGAASPVPGQPASPFVAAPAGSPFAPTPAAAPTPAVPAASPAPAAPVGPWQPTLPPGMQAAPAPTAAAAPAAVQPGPEVPPWQR